MTLGTTCSHEEDEGTGLTVEGLARQAVVFDADDETGVSTRMSVLMPNLGGGEFRLLAQADGASNATTCGWASGLDGSSTVSLPLATPPALADSADGVTNVVMTLPSFAGIGLPLLATTTRTWAVIEAGGEVTDRSMTRSVTVSATAGPWTSNPCSTCWTPTSEARTFDPRFVITRILEGAPRRRLDEAKRPRLLALPMPDRRHAHVEVMR